MALGSAEVEDSLTMLSLIQPTKNAHSLFAVKSPKQEKQKDILKDTTKKILYKFILPKTLKPRLSSKPY